jgi:hypothetical protein
MGRSMSRAASLFPGRKPVHASVGSHRIGENSRSAVRFSTGYGLVSPSRYLHA